MSNVLPKDTLKSGWKMFRSRFVLVGALSLIGLATLTVAALLPAYVALHADASDRASKEEVSQNTEAQAARDELIQAQILLTRISPLISSTSSPATLVQSVASLAPAGIVLEQIALTAGATDAMIVKGTAADRDAINVYRDALAGSGLFRSVNIPVEALVGAAEGKFTIMLSGVF